MSFPPSSPAGVQAQSVPIPPFLASILSNHLLPAPSAQPSSQGGSLNPSPSLPQNSAGSSSTAQVPPVNALYLPPPALPSLEEDLVPPENFSLVSTGVYRSGFPKKRNFGFMQTLRLKTVLTLVLEDYPEANLAWCQSQDIQFMQFGIPGNKEPFDNIPEDVICSALVAILDVRNHPILIHCNKGKHRTGCLIGCIRRLQSWSLTSIFDEYRRFSSPKSRAVDQQFIDLFDIAPVWEEALAKGGGLDNLPKWEMLVLPRKRPKCGAGGKTTAIMPVQHHRPGPTAQEGQSAQVKMDPLGQRNGTATADTKADINPPVAGGDPFINVTGGVHLNGTTAQTNGNAARADLAETTTQARSGEGPVDTTGKGDSVDGVVDPTAQINLGERAR
ncbi:hypothetical protein IAU60_005143 [Kwoniella sp. DSM 27419]